MGHTYNYVDCHRATFRPLVWREILNFLCYGITYRKRICREKSLHLADYILCYGTKFECTVRGNCSWEPCCFLMQRHQCDNVLRHLNESQRATSRNRSRRRTEPLRRVTRCPEFSWLGKPRNQKLFSTARKFAKIGQIFFILCIFYEFSHVNITELRFWFGLISVLRPFDTF